MKRALRLAGCCVLIGAGISAVRGDPPSSSPPAKPVKTPPAPSAVIPGVPDPIARLPDVSSTTTPPVSTPPDGPSADPGSIDFSTTDPEEIAQETLRVKQENKEQPEMDAEAWKQRQQEETADHDWMLREYQKQLRKNGLDKTPEPTPDPYGPATTDENGNPSGEDPLLPSSSPPRKSKTLESESTDTSSDKSPSVYISPFSLPPLLPPLIASDKNAGAHPESFAGDLQSDSNSPASAMGPAIPTQPGDSSMLDIPGMTAAQEGMPSGDLSLEDRLPDEPPTVRIHDDQNNFLPPTAPLNDADAFYKKQAASLQPPNAPTFQALVTPPVTVNSYKQPSPPTAKPVINGLRTHIADPFDFLNRPHNSGDQ